VTPALENCAIPMDEDCDGLAQPCKGTPVWSKRAGDAAGQHPWGLAVGAGGDILVVGDFTGTIDLGGCPLSKAAGSGLFVAKLDSSGACLWSKSGGDAGSQFALAVALDPAGNVLVSGDFTDAMDLGGCPLSDVGGADLFVAKLDPSGACLWSKRAASAHGSSIAVDGASNVLIAGSFYDATELGGCPLSPGGALDFFVAKLDPSGACLWSKRAGDGSIQSGEGVAVDSSGNVVVTGNFTGAMDLEGCPLQGSASSGLFLAKMSPSGVCLWSKAANGLSSSGKGVAIDGAGNVLVTGDFVKTMELGGCTLSKVAGSGVFVEKLDPSGACVWSKSTGDDGAQYGKAVAVDAVDNVLLTGSFLGSFNFGGGAVVSAGAGDIFLVKLDADGGYLWGQRAGGSASDLGKAVAADGIGNVVVTGDFSGTADFGTGPLVSAGGADVVVAKYSP
jgi:hypothetical protein